MSEKSEKNVGVASVPANKKQPSRFILIHGDKGGVGKSVVAEAVADYFHGKGEKVAIIDSDTRNPDVSRMFKTTIPSCQANLRNGNGWMDVMDFVMKYHDHTIIMNTPSGIGEYLPEDMQSFSRFLKEQGNPFELELWWVMNVQHDSVNLLDRTLTDIGQHFTRTRVICNMFFSGNTKAPFFLWDESDLKVRLEKAGAKTIYLTGLHSRVVLKLFVPDMVMPYSEAQDASIGERFKFSHSEYHKLREWIKNTNQQFDFLFSAK